MLSKMANTNDTEMKTETETSRPVTTEYGRKVMKLLLLKVHSEDPVLLASYREQAEKHNKKIMTDQHYDSGFDLYTPELVCFEKTKQGTIDFKVSCACYEDSWNPETGKYETWPVGYYLYPRSSISKTPLLLANSVGIIDSGYRGTVKAKLWNVGDSDSHHTNTGYNRVFHATEYSRLMQITMGDLSPFLVEIVTELDDTTRGAGGYGSTGGTCSETTQHIIGGESTDISWCKFHRPV